MGKPLQIVLVVVAWLMACTSPSPAADALQLVSGDAVFVVRLKSPHKALDRAQVLADRALPADAPKELLAGLRETVERLLGAAISNDELAGVDRNADWLIWADVPAGGDARVVFQIPAGDPAALRRALGDGIKSIEHGGQVIYSEDQAALESVRRRIDGQGRSFAELVDKADLALFERDDLAVIVNIAHLRSVFADELKAIAEGLAADPKRSAENRPQAARAYDLFAGFFADPAGTALQALADARTFTIGVAVSPEGVSAEALVRVDPESPTDKALGRQQLSAFGGLAKLPAGCPAYFSFLSAEYLRWMYGYRLADPATDEGRAQADRLAKQEFKDAYWIYATDKRDEGLLPCICISESDNASVLRDLDRGLHARGWPAETAQDGQTKIEYTRKNDAEDLGTHRADVTTAEYSSVPGTAVPEYAAFANAFVQGVYGDAGQVVRTVALPDRLVETTGGGSELMRRTLAALEGAGDGAASDASFRSTRAHFADPATALALVDVPRTATRVYASYAMPVMLLYAGDEIVEQYFADLLPAFLQPLVSLLPTNLASLEALLDTFESAPLPSYSGLAATNEPRGLRLKLFLPARQIETCYSLFAKLVELNRDKAEEPGDELENGL